MGLDMYLGRAKKVAENKKDGFEFEEVDELTVTERGEGGFGSSGNFKI